MKALFKYLLGISKRQKQKSTTFLYPVVRGKKTHNSCYQITYLRTAFLTILFTVPQFAIFAGMTAKKTFAQSTSCPSGTTVETLNWTATNNRADIESQTPSIEDITASFRFTESSSGVIDDEETRIFGDGPYGGLPAPNLQFNIGEGSSPAPPNGTATLTINFNRPVTLASPLQLLDIDRNGERDVGFVYQDVVRVAASNGNTPVGVNLTAVGRNVRIVNNQARGIRENSFPDRGDGNALAEVTAPVTQIRIIYSAGTEFGTPEQDETIGLARLRLCVGTPDNGSIGDTVFTDPNGNGVQDTNNEGVPNSGENGIPNTTLTLRNSDNEVVATTTTDDNGRYQFTDVPLGEYTVESGTPNDFSPTTRTILSVNLTGDNPNRDDIDFGFRPGQVGAGGDVNLRLVKRITNLFRNGQSIGGNFNSFIDDPNDDDDNLLTNNSPQTSPLGVPQLETPVRSGDEVEYTVYYLTEGADPLQNVRLCDLIPQRTNFSPNAFGNGTGIALRQGANNTTFTNAQDSDRGTFYSPLTPLSGQVGADACSNQSNQNGAVIVNIGTITPSDNFGFFRFRVRID